MALYSFEIGGSERLGVQLIRHYLDHGINVVCCGTRLGAGPIISHLKALGIPHLALQLEYRTRLGRMLQKRNLTNWLRDHQVECIHAQHFCVLSDVYASAVAAGVGRQIVTEHSAEPILNSRRYARTTASLARKATNVVAINEVTKNAICKVSRLEHSAVMVIENGVDTQRFSPSARERLGTVNIVWLGRLHPDKNILAALRAFHEATRRCRVDLRLHIVGEGADRTKAQRFVVEQGIANLVTFHGERDDPECVLKDGNIFLMSSRTEGTPLALLEAMSCGLPVIATAVGGIPQIVSEKVGQLVDAGDEIAMADSLVKLAENQQQRHSLGDAARKLVDDRFSANRMAAEYIKLIVGSQQTTSK
jgi:glycosyltransferase involved in cell wall biosynthesis